MTEHPAIAFFHWSRSQKKRKAHPALLAALQARIAAMPDKRIEEMSDQELRDALDACDFDCEEHERLMAEAERRQLDI